MNKNDKILIVIIFCLASFMLLFLFLFQEQGEQALVYHNSVLLKTINLNKDAIYQVEGDLGVVELEVKNNQIRVKQENSPYHLCSKQGFISGSNETIICMPNKIAIEIVGKSQLDTQVK